MPFVSTSERHGSSRDLSVDAGSAQYGEGCTLHNAIVVPRSGAGRSSRVQVSGGEERRAQFARRTLVHEPSGIGIRRSPNLWQDRNVEHGRLSAEVRRAFGRWRADLKARDLPRQQPQHRHIVRVIGPRVMDL
jgi:hypothetical protein